jgi:hypothetical protein
LDRASGGNQRPKVLVGIDLVARLKLAPDLIHFLEVERVVIKQGVLLQREKQPEHRSLTPE